jgi:AraC family transcriptional regulator of adaptative response / DNA-3-methyladenine glycosylase II
MLTFDLPYHPPYDWASLLGFLRMRSVPGVERAISECYRRTLRLGECAGWIEVENAPDQSRLRVRAGSSLRPVAAQLERSVRRQFDVDRDPHAIAQVLGPLALNYPGLRVPGAIDGFEQGVRAILGQQISVAAATTLAGRIARQLGDVIATPHAGLDRLFPTAQHVAALEPIRLIELGIIGARARSIIAYADALSCGRLVLDEGVAIEATLEVLRALPGIGEWTAQYMALRCLSWADAFPHTDLIVRRQFPGMTPREVLAAAEKWRPWRGYATLHLWKNS